MSQTENTLKLPFQKSHAFVIGINDYQHVSTLSTAVKDATDIADLLEDTGKHGYTVHRYLNPTKAKMEEAFQAMEDLVQPEDRVIFYFAGHGIAHDSEGDPEGFIVPADAKTEEKATLISMDVLHKTLTKLPCKHGLLILDCCFAGAFKWSTGFRDLVTSTPETLYAERFWRFVEHPAWQVITSSAHDQKAADVLNKEALGLREEEENASEDKNSPFAWALKQAIDLHSKADTAGHKRSDGVVTATELYLYLREIVEKATHTNGKRQSPAIFTLGKHDTKGEYIFLNPGHKLNLPEAPNRNPYKGLGPYEPTEADAQTFFGREKAIQEMAEKLNHTALLVVSAPSGQGKSSTVKAGLFPFLRKQGYETLISLRPGDRAFDDWEALRQIDPSKKQIVLIDQYEEMFALEEPDRAFLEQILLDIKDKLPLSKLILTVRSDFEWQLQTTAFGQSFWQEENIRKFLYRLPPMTSEELREIMIKPAWVVAYEFESEELINQILEEINHAPGALPLLSFTLHKLFELRDRDQRLLTKKAYQEELGGVNGALSNHADQIYLNLPSPAHQNFMRKLLLRMVRLNDGSYSRRRVYFKTPSRKSEDGFIDELNYPDHLDATKDEVLKILGDSLLLSNGQDKFGPYVEPMHDSLINFWPRCLQWIQDFGRENLVLQRDIWKAVVEHHQWEKDIYGTPDGREPTAPLWDNNPKLQQVQIAITDPKDEWLCKKGWADKSISSIAYLLWERKPTSHQMEEMAAWNWFFQSDDPEERYQKIQAQMDHWLNEEELAFVKQSFEEQRSELERIKAERDEARLGEEKAMRVAKFFREKSRENYNTALAHLRHLLKLADGDPTYDVYRVEEPQLYFQMGDKKQAISIFGKLINQASEDNKELYFSNMAVFYLTHDEIDDAIANYKQWILLKSEEEINEKCSIAIQQFKQKNKEDHIITLLQKLIDESDQPEVQAGIYRMMAEHYEASGKYQEAIPAICNAISLSDQLEYLSLLCKLYTNAQKPEKGQQVFLDLLKKNNLGTPDDCFLIENDPNARIQIARQEKYTYVSDGSAIVRFRNYRKGFYLMGAAGKNNFISKNYPFLLANTSLTIPIINVLSITIENEGQFDSINTWDNSFLSFGIGQWPIGMKESKGELPALLKKIKEKNAGIFHQYFGKYGLDISNDTTKTNGYLMINGALANKAGVKEQFRRAPWAFLFWKAAQEPLVKAVQLDHFMGRLNYFYWKKSHSINGYLLSQIITSEYGVAQVLDMHFNRPGYVKRCLENALNETGLIDPDSWTTEEENKLLEAFLKIRRTFGKSPMTNALKRENTIKKYLNLGLISEEKGSFLEGYNQRRK